MADNRQRRLAERQLHRQYCESHTGCEFEELPRPPSRPEMGECPTGGGPCDVPARCETVAEDDSRRRAGRQDERDRDGEKANSGWALLRSTS